MSFREAKFHFSKVWRVGVGVCSSCKLLNPGNHCHKPRKYRDYEMNNRHWTRCRPSCLMQAKFAIVTTNKLLVATTMYSWTWWLRGKFLFL